MNWKILILILFLTKIYKLCFFNTFIGFFFDQRIYAFTTKGIPLSPPSPRPTKFAQELWRRFESRCLEMIQEMIHVRMTTNAVVHFSLKGRSCSMQGRNHKIILGAAV